MFIYVYMSYLFFITLTVVVDNGKDQHRTYDKDILKQTNTHSWSNDCKFNLYISVSNSFLESMNGEGQSAFGKMMKVL